jgi:hypothetical protein
MFDHEKQIQNMEEILEDEKFNQENELRRMLEERRKRRANRNLNKEDVQDLKQKAMEEAEALCDDEKRQELDEISRGVQQQEEELKRKGDWSREWMDKLKQERA